VHETSWAAALVWERDDHYASEIGEPTGASWASRVNANLTTHLTTSDCAARRCARLLRSLACPRCAAIASSALTTPQPWLQVFDPALLAVLFDQRCEVQRRLAAFYVLLRASLHFPFFQYMYVPQLPAGLAFV
jgi:hypothetical protein